MLDESRNLLVVFAYPTMGSINIATNDITNAKTEEIFEIIYSCVDHIFGEKIYPSKDTNRDEMIEFFDSISQESLRKY